MKWNYKIIKRVLLTCFLTLVAIHSYGQKAVIDTLSYRNWTKLWLENGINSSGTFAWYKYGTRTKNILVVSSVNRLYKTEFTDGSALCFTSDGNKFLFRKGLDSLGIFDCKKIKYTWLSPIEDVKSFQNGRNKWLIVSRSTELVLWDLDKDIKHSFAPVNSFQVSSSGERIIAQGKYGNLYYLDVRSAKMTKISSFRDISGLTIDETGHHIAFLNRNIKGIASIYEYHTGLDSAKRLVDQGSSAFDFKYELDGMLTFSPNGKHLYFKVKKIESEIGKDADLLTEHLVIWNYKDRMLKKQIDPLEAGKELTSAVVSVETGKIIRLESDSEMSPILNLGSRYFITQTMVDAAQSYWDNNEWPTVSLIDIDKGTRRKIATPEMTVNGISVHLSPDEKFVTWMNRNTGDLFSYEISTNILRNLTVNLKLPIDIISQASIDPSQKISENILGWLPGLTFFILADKYDLWKIDPSGQVDPVNLTNGYGRKNDITFRLDQNTSIAATLNFEWPGKLILNTFNNKTKSYGYATLRLSGRPELEILSEEACIFSSNQGMHIPVKKSQNGNVFLVSKESEDRAANVFISRDLKSFRQLSDVAPQKDYNWYTTKLINWKMYDGNIGQGVMYLPENFDPSKKYPVIFYYYQGLAKERLHTFINLDDVAGADRSNLISIPEYTSAGYVVFVPEILNTKPGYISDATINAVESAAKYLVNNFSWIDGKRLGLQGHSFGGYETNILIAGSNVFAAASASASVTNVIRGYGDRGFAGQSLASMHEKQQYNLGGTLWDSLGVYIRNSPLFSVKNITTPLLLSHGTLDGKISVSQPIELFTALRRLHKPVWLLEYELAAHTFDGNYALDFAIRQRQFFDHYLMGKPAPIWMTEGVPTKYQGIKSGLQLDLRGKQP